MGKNIILRGFTTVIVLLFTILPIAGQSQSNFKNEIANRTATVVYGTDGTMTLDDTVLNWRNTGSCPN